MRLRQLLWRRSLWVRFSSLWDFMYYLLFVLELQDQQQRPYHGSHCKDNRDQVCVGECACVYVCYCFREREEGIKIIFIQVLLSEGRKEGLALSPHNSDWCLGVLQGEIHKNLLAVPWKPGQQTVQQREEQQQPQLREWGEEGLERDPTAPACWDGRHLPSDQPGPRHTALHACFPAGHSQSTLHFIPAHPLVILSPHILFSNCSITQHLIHYQMITTSHEFQTKRRSVKTARRDCSLYFKKSNRNYFQNARRKILLWKSSLKSPKTFCYVFFRHWETPGMPSKCFTTTNQRMVKDWCQPWFGVWKIQPFLRKFLGLLFWWVALLTSKRPFNVQMTLLKERCFKDLMLLKVYIKLKVYISVIIFMTGMSSVQESISQVISSAHSNLSSFKQTSFFEMQV